MVGGKGPVWGDSIDKRNLAPMGQLGQLLPPSPRRGPTRPGIVVNTFRMYRASFKLPMSRSGPRSLWYRT
jgi:hypothetical protein